MKETATACVCLPAGVYNDFTPVIRHTQPISSNWAKIKLFIAYVLIVIVYLNVIKNRIPS